MNHSFPTSTKIISAKKRGAGFTMITIVLPIGSKMPTIQGKWERLQNGCIRARYTPDEYQQCLELFEVIRDAKAG